LIGGKVITLKKKKKVQDLCRLVKTKKPGMVFPMEIKSKQNKMERIQCKLGFLNMLVVNSVGKSGGLVLFWEDEVGVEIQNYSSHHINQHENLLNTELGVRRGGGGAVEIHGFLWTPGCEQKKEGMEFFTSCFFGPGTIGLYGRFQ
jgi:hypothetical protein